MRKSDNRLWEALFPLLTIGMSALLFLPIFQPDVSTSLILKIHVISYLVLGCFFEIPELALNLYTMQSSRQVSTLTLRRNSLIQVFRVRYFLTHFVAPCSGIMVVLSGLALTHYGEFSFSQGWLFWILIAAIIGLYKGMNHHNQYMKHLFTSFLNTHNNPRDIQKIVFSKFDQFCIFVEFPTYMFIYFVALYKPEWWTPAKSTILHTEQWLQSPGLWGLWMVISGAVLIPVIRKTMQLYSVVWLIKAKH